MNFLNNRPESARIAELPLLLLFCVLPSLLTAQFLNIQVEVEPQVEATVERSLSFGTLPTNSGLTEFPLGDPDMGVFAIRAVQTQRLLISLEVPDQLLHTNLNAAVPVGLQLAVTDFGVNDYRQAVPVTDANREITISPPPGQPDREWSFAYFYLYGWMEVGSVPPGIYTGDVVLNIEYD